MATGVAGYGGDLVEIWGGMWVDFGFLEGGMGPIPPHTPHIPPYPTISPNTPHISFDDNYITLLFDLFVY